VDEENVSRLERIWETVNSAGWKDLEEEFNSKIEQIKTALVTDFESTGDLLRVAQGRILVYRELLSLHAAIQYTFEQMKVKDTDDDTV
jgi:hypothetical protein